MDMLPVLNVHVYQNSCGGSELVSVGLSAHFIQLS